MWPFDSDDPLKELDPSLRSYLAKENRRSASAAAQQAPPQPLPPKAIPEDTKHDGTIQRTWGQLFGLSTSNSNYVDDRPTQNDPLDRDERPAVPKESLYQDGRYADLWKSYRPANEVESAGKSDQEKLLDIVHAYRDRQGQLSRAATENCANEQYAVHECFRTGGWSSRMTMCSAESRELQKCILHQSKFLRILGYLDMWDRSENESERIQMHADKLYQKQRAQEKALDEAKEKGEPLPSFAPLIQVAGESPSSPDTYTLKPSKISFDDLPQKVQDSISQGRLAGLDSAQLALAKRELEQEIAAQTDFFKQIDSHYVAERRERLQRQSEGRERMTDKVKRWFDMRDFSKADEAEAAAARDREAQRKHAALEQQQGH